MRKNYWIQALFLIGLFSFIGIVIISCDDKLESKFIFDEEIFISEWDSWNNHGIKNYSFTLIEGKKWITELFSSRTLGVPPSEPFIEEWKIIVKNGIMDSFEYTYYNLLFEENNFIGFFPSNSGYIKNPLVTTISDIYQRTSISIANLRQWKVDMEVNNKYDPSFNYITFHHWYRLLYDRYDDGYTFVVSDFEILE